jgi:DNA adenine methylase
MITSYPGGKGMSGMYQKLINQIPPHRVYIESHLGGGAVIRYKRLAEINIGVDVNMSVLEQWNDTDSLSLIQSDAVCFLEKYKFIGDEFIYVDPPYLADTRSSHRAIYNDEYTVEQHVALLKAINKLPCNVMISGYHSELYRDSLVGWRSFFYESRNRAGKKTTEWIWMNYPKPVELHDYQYLGEDFREREKIKRRIQRWVSRLEDMPILEKHAVLNAIGVEMV